MNEPCFVVAFVSGKGGTGKTTLTANFAAELGSSLQRSAAPGSGIKNRVLVIDNDYATGGASYLLAGGERLKTGAESAMIQPQTCFYDCYSNRIPPKDVTPLRLIFEDPSVGEFQVDVMLNSLAWWRTPLPSAMDESEPPEIVLDGSAEGFLDRNLLPYYEALLQRFRQEYDYILIDSRGGADTRASVAAVVADSIVIVTEPGDVAGKQDLSFVHSLRSLAQQIGREVGGVSVIYNRVLGSEREPRGARHSDLTVIGRLPISENVVECYRNTELIFERRPLDPFCLEATRAFEARFPGEQGICRVRRKRAEALMRLRKFTADAGAVLQCLLLVLAFAGTLGFVILVGRDAGRAGAGLEWVRVLLPVTVLAAGGALGCDLLHRSFESHIRSRGTMWLAGGVLTLMVAVALALSSYGSLSVVRDAVGG